MKTSLWTVIALVTGIVGFLVGYSVSAYTGSKNALNHGGAASAAHADAPPAKAAAAPAKTEAGGYGAAAEKPKAGAAAAPAGEKPAKTAAAGY